ncbi:MAG TPA: undecaprenyldiphospho-muramoylpentapeptide beta-N-acetylglucosaminyltransferase [Propylenella sp.]
MTQTALLVAGGTGGHLFPALALREVLIDRGWRVHVATDPRVGGLIDGVPPAETHRVSSATIAGWSPLTMARSIATLLDGVLKARKLLRQVAPQIVVGFGGYPTVPPIVAARLAAIPIVVHEQNAVVGRANRLLLRFGAVLATGFANPKWSAGARRTVHVGNPVRRAVVDIARPYAPSGPGEPFRLFVFGGSQGARVFSGLIPAALAALPEDKRRRLLIAQQARPEDAAATRENFRGIGVEAVVAPFFADIGERLAGAHLVVCRAGASTVAELAAAGRPAILVPYPYALDHDQAENARLLEETGGGWLVPEKDLTPAMLAKRVAALMDSPKKLARAAEAARAQGRPDAAARLAELVERVARPAA